MSFHGQHTLPALHPEDTERRWMVPLNKSDPSAVIMTEIRLPSAALHPRSGVAGVARSLRPMATYKHMQQLQQKAQH